MPPFLKIRRDWNPRKIRKIEFGKFGAFKFWEIGNLPFREIGLPLLKGPFLFFKITLHHLKKSRKNESALITVFCWNSKFCRKQKFTCSRNLSSYPHIPTGFPTDVYFGKWHGFSREFLIDYFILGTFT